MSARTYMHAYMLAYTYIHTCMHVEIATTVQEASAAVLCVKQWSTNTLSCFLMPLLAAVGVRLGVAVLLLVRR